MNQIYSIALLIIVSLTSCRSSKQLDDRIANRLQKKIQSKYSSNPESIGIMVHLEYPKENLKWSGAVGYSNKESKTKLNLNQPILIASNTKTFVAAAILRLVENGKLKTSSPIKSYLSNRTIDVLTKAKYDLQEIQISHLLSHTSGINDYVASAEFEDKLQNEPKYHWTRNEQIEIAILRMNMVGRAGERYKYSDTNYLLLTEIIEQVTGIEFHKAISQLLNFEKNAFHSTWFEGLESAPSGILPISHQYIGEWNLDTYDIDKSFDLYGGGGLASTTEELSLFIHKLFNGGIFKNTETINLLLTKIDTKEKSNDDYRFGIWKSRINNKIVYGHGGFWGTMVYYIPEMNATMSIAILNKDKSHLRKEIAEIIMKELEK